MIPKSQHRYSLTLKKTFPGEIALSLARHPMLETVKLDAQPRKGTIEVHVVSTEVMLTAKFEASEAPSFQGIPELSFLLGLVLAQKSRDLRRGHPPKLSVQGVSGKI